MSRRSIATILVVLLLSVRGKAADADKDLRKAAEKCEVAKVHQLLAKGADAKGQDEKGVTALMLAAGKGCAEAVQALLDEGADAEAKDSTGSTAAIWAGRHDYADIVNLLATPRSGTAGADARAGACASTAIKGSTKKGSHERDFAASKARVREVVFDAMSAAGFVVKEERPQTIEAVRKYPELSDEGRSSGEKLLLSLETVQESGSSRTRVTAEDKWGGMWASGRTRYWSDMLFDQAECLLELFDLRTDEEILGEDRAQPDRVQQAGQTISVGGTTLPDGTPVKMRLRRYLSANEQKESGRFAFVVTDDVVLNGTVFVQKGATGWGQVKNAEQSKSFNRNAKLVFSVDYVRAINGHAIPVRDYHEALGGTNKGKTGASIAAQAAVNGGVGILGMAFTRGKNVGIRAGTEFIVFSDGDHSLNLKTAP